MNQPIEKPLVDDQFDRYVESLISHEREVWEERLAVSRHEMRHVREQNERLMQMLTGISALLPPPPIEAQGQTYVFVDPNANATLRELSRRISAIVDSVHVIRNAQIMAATKPPNIQS